MKKITMFWYSGNIKVKKIDINFPITIINGKLMDAGKIVYTYIKEKLTDHKIFVYGQKNDDFFISASNKTVPKSSICFDKKVLCVKIKNTSYTIPQNTALVLIPCNASLKFRKHAGSNAVVITIDS